jgi:hypothetical protein
MVAIAFILLKRSVILIIMQFAIQADKIAISDGM